MFKDCRVKDATSVVWKFDSAVEAAIRDALRHVAIDEGQWTEKRDGAGGAGQLAHLKARINRGCDRVAAARKAAEERGENGKQPLVLARPSTRLMRNQGPGAATGCVVKDYRGKDATSVV